MRHDPPHKHLSCIESCAVSTTNHSHSRQSRGRRPYGFIISVHWGTVGRRSTTARRRAARKSASRAARPTASSRGSSTSMAPPTGAKKQDRRRRRVFVTIRIPGRVFHSHGEARACTSTVHTSTDPSETPQAHLDPTMRRTTGPALTLSRARQQMRGSRTRECHRHKGHAHPWSCRPHTSKTWCRAGIQQPIRGSTRLSSPRSGDHFKNTATHGPISHLACRAWRGCA